MAYVSVAGASVAETYGPQKTASIAGFINMCGQLVGATSLAASGYSAC